jgi:hypothetical protein
MQELADRIEERLGLDERAVQIDAERARQIVALDRLGDLEILEQDVLVKLPAPARPRKKSPCKARAAEGKRNAAAGKLCVKYTVKRQLAEGEAIAQEELDWLTIVPSLLHEVIVSKLNGSSRIARDGPARTKPFRKLKRP